MRLWLAAAGALALFVAPAQAGLSRPPLETLGTLHPTTTVADAFLVSQPAPQRLSVRDLRTRATRDVALPPSCRLVAARHSLALLECEVPLSGWPGSCLRPYLALLATGELRYIRVAEQRGAIDGCQSWVRYHAVGRHWMAGSTRHLNPHPGPSYLRWRTGELRHSATGAPYDPYDPGPPADLDDPGLRPLADRAWEREGDAEILNRRDAGSPLRLRVGRKPPVTLSRCRAGCRSVTLTGGRVVWKAGETGLRAYVVATRALWRWRVPPGLTYTTPGATLIRAGARGYVVRWAR